MNSQGKTIWSRIYKKATYDKARASVLSKDGGLIIAGSTAKSTKGDDDAWVFKIDHNGNKLWDKTYRQGKWSWDFAYTMVAVKSGGVVVGGKTRKKSRARIFKLNNDGDIVWDHIFNADKYGINVSLTVSNDDGFLLVSIIIKKLKF